MFALFFLGRMLEPAIGTPRFVALYFASLFGGAFGALAAQRPDALTVGASGAIFGIFGATFVIARGRGFDASRLELGVLLADQPGLHLRRSATSASAATSVGSLPALLCALLIVAGERGMLGPHAACRSS